jgi:hypothetical protein
VRTRSPVGVRVDLDLVKRVAGGAPDPDLHRPRRPRRVRDSGAGGVQDRGARRVGILAVVALLLAHAGQHLPRDVVELALLLVVGQEVGGDRLAGRLRGRPPAARRAGAPVLAEQRREDRDAEHEREREQQQHREQDPGAEAATRSDSHHSPFRTAAR